MTTPPQGTNSQEALIAELFKITTREKTVYSIVLDLPKLQQLIAARERAAYKKGFDFRAKFLTEDIAAVERVKADIERAAEERVLDELEKYVDRLKLEFDVVICDCGIPYKDTDPHDVVLDMDKAIATKRQSLHQKKEKE